MVQFPRLVVVPNPGDHSPILRRPFYADAASDEVHPVVAVATGFAAKGLALQTLEGLSGGDARAIVERARKNLASGTRSWQVAEKSGFIFKKPRLLRGMGDPTVSPTAMATDGGGIDDLASDLVLDPSFMLEAGAMLGSSELIAAIPKRGWLMVGKCVPGNVPVMVEFNKIAQGIASRGGTHTLTPNCYFVRGGNLVGVSGEGFFSLLSSDATTSWNLG